MASTVAASDVGDSSFLSNNADSSSLSLESSFRLEPAYPNEGVESERNPKAKRKRTTWVPPN